MKSLLVAVNILIVLLFISGCKSRETVEMTDILKPEDNYELGSMYLDDGDFERAIGQFILAIAKKKDYVEAYGGLATAYFLRGNAYCLKKDYEQCTNDHHSAMRTYLQALKMKKDFEYGYYGIGRILFVRWQLEKNPKWAQEAIKYLETAYKLNNKRVMTSYYLGLCYLAIGRLESAKIHLDEYLKKSPNALNAHLVKQFLDEIETKTAQDKYSKILEELEKEYMPSQQ
ncbi:MAG: tetratricopeptide repeat protein [Planctomycetota bacterium]